MALLVVLTSAFSAAGTTFIIPGDDVLVRKADGIVSGAVLESRAELTPEGGVRTVTTLWVDRVLSGPFHAGQLIELVQPGGVTPTRALRIHGTPRFVEGDLVLVFVEIDDRGGLTTLDLALGKFSFRRDAHGIEYLLRDEGSICGWAPGFEPYREKARRAGAFLDFVEEVLRGQAGSDDYAVEYAEACVDAEQELTASPEAAIAYSFCDCRWSVFTPPTTTVSFLTSGTQAGLSDSLGAVSRGTAVWTTDEGSTIQYQRGGTTTVTQGFVSFDGINAILFDDPSDEIAGAFTGSGVLAIGGPWAGGNHSFDGAAFSTISGADVVVQDGVGGSTGISQGEFDAILAHEIGHTLGFRHSDDPGAPNATSAALMNSFLNRSSATLSAWDREAAASMYGTGAAGCTGVSIASQPQAASISSGNTRTLSVTVAGTPDFTYQWFQGTSGDTSVSVQGPTTTASKSSSFTTPPLTASTTHWVRVTNCGGVNAANSGTAATTVTCTATIVGQPQPVSIPSGSSATLAVAVGSGTYSYQWFRGASGNTSSPIGGATSSSLSTGALSAEASFWARVTRTDCPQVHVVNSAAATVSICTRPAITGEPQDATVVTGNGASLSVSATGTNPTFQWYRGASGNTSNPAQSGSSSSFFTGVLTGTSTFWVRVSNACGGTQIADSRTVTVAVVPQCVPPAISVQPQSTIVIEGRSTTLSVTATGTGLLYQWFEGQAGDFSKPVGTSSPNHDTGVLTQTKSFWVQISNSCGQLNSATATVSVQSGCPSGALCALNGRFTLTLAARDFRTGVTGSGMALQQNDIFGFYALPAFTGSADNPEVFVKVLDGRAVNGEFWTFFGGLTDLEYTLNVTDTVTGITKNYFKPGGSSAGGFDTGSGIASEECAGEVEGTPLPAESPSDCVAQAGWLCLNGKRFRVELTARDQRTGATGSGASIPQGDLFGYFSIPALTGNASNPEVFVKVIDARSFGGHFWVFFSGLTDLEYTLTVTDTVTGEKKRYAKAAGSACGAFDTNGFAGP